nr:homoserine dehydrogenase [Clostridia bacterium]
MINIAILGFGVVGGGVAELITENQSQILTLAGDSVNIKYILDLRDFPSSPFASRVIHDFNVILADPEVSTVIEAMGGSHPAYEYTVAALSAGKNVITSNKEVVARFGDEFLKIARENGVCYRFEAAVGGGIPVLSPIISCIGQNKVTEVRGILNGTTNYILTQMFTFGRSFEDALADAQAKGYAESNPDADILGIDACRKIAILTALVTGKLISTDNIHTEGITAIRAEDVVNAGKLGCTIKLVGRGLAAPTVPMALVAPFLVPTDMPLSSVTGVYNAVEVIAEPLGDVMFYGKGAGAGATASAVVGDLMQVICSGTHCHAPVFEKCDAVPDFEGYSSRHYLAFSAADSSKAAAAFPSASVIESDEYVITTEKMSEGELSSRLASAGILPVSHIRFI